MAEQLSELKIKHYRWRIRMHKILSCVLTRCYNNSCVRNKIELGRPKFEKWTQNLATSTKIRRGNPKFGHELENLGGYDMSWMSIVNQVLLYFYLMTYKTLRRTDVLRLKIILGTFPGPRCRDQPTKGGYPHETLGAAEIWAGQETPDGVIIFPSRAWGRVSEVHGNDKLGKCDSPGAIRQREK